MNDLTRRDKRCARLVAATKPRRRSLKAIFDSFARVRMKLPKGMSVKDLIEEGRGF